MEGILKGIRVLDLGRFISCPFCGMLLADMGAEVIKIERVGVGEDGRRLGPYKDNVSVYVTAFNRNKKGMTINFRTVEGKKVFEELIKQSDVIIENFRPGTMAKMGFDYETVKKLNPRIIMASISGFGQTGKYRDKAAFDGIASAMSGLYMVNSTTERPKSTGLALGDHITGVYHTLAIMMALYDRTQTGEGQYIDTAMLDCLFSMFETRLADYVLNDRNIGVIPSDSGYGDPLACPSNLYRCKDGYVCLHAGTDPNFSRFAQVSKIPQFQDQTFAKIESRMANYKFVDQLVADWFLNYTAQEADTMMTEAGIPCGIVNDMSRIVNDSNSLDREMIIYTEVPGIGKVPFAGNPLKLKTRPIINRERAPMIGEHTDSILAELLNYSESEIEKLHNAGAV